MGRRNGSVEGDEMVALDALAAVLTEAKPVSPNLGGGFKVDGYFRKRPQVLEAIRVMRRDRDFTFAEIAELVTAEDGRYISANAIKGWLKTQGIT